MIEEKIRPEDIVSGYCYTDRRGKQRVYITTREGKTYLLNKDEVFG